MKNNYKENFKMLLKAKAFPILMMERETQRGRVSLPNLHN